MDNYNGNYNNQDYNQDYNQNYNQNYIQDYNQEPEPQQGGGGMSLKKAGLLLAGVIIAIVVVLSFVMGIVQNKEKGTEVPVENSNEVVLEQQTQSSDINAEVVESTEAVSETTQNTVEETTEAVVKNGGETSSTEGIEQTVQIKKVSTPTLGDPYETSVVVSGKDVFMAQDKQYLYAISLIFPTGDGYEIIKYYCPKSTYDAVTQGETIKAEYQLDNNGLVSITSISR